MQTHSPAPAQAAPAVAVARPTAPAARAAATDTDTAAAAPAPSSTAAAKTKTAAPAPEAAAAPQAKKAKTAKTVEKAKEVAKAIKRAPVPKPAGKPVPPPPEERIVRRVVDLTPENGVTMGEDGLYSDRRGQRPIMGWPRFHVVNGHIYPKLTASELPAKWADRENGGIYPTAANDGRCGTWSARGEKLVLKCPWCPLLVLDFTASNQAHYPHEDGGTTQSICGACRDIVELDKTLPNECQKCFNFEANFPAKGRDKGNHLCSKCAHEEGTWYDRSKRCEKHGIYYYHCTDCCPIEKLANSFCIICKTKHVNSDMRKEGVETCLDCRSPEKVKKRNKEDEEALCAFLLSCGFKEEKNLGARLPSPGCFKREHIINFDCAQANSTNKQGNASTFCRIDFILNLGGIFFFIEVDEHQHRFGFYNPKMACDMKRMVDVHATILLAAERGGDRVPLPYWIRFNPRAWRVGRDLVDVPIEVRHRFLLERLRSALPSPKARVEYLYYNLDADGELRVLQHEAYLAQMREVAFTSTTADTHAKK